MWRKGGEEQRRTRLRVADTVLLQRGAVRAWLFTAQDGTVKRKGREKCTLPLLKEALERMAEPGHMVAVARTAADKNGKANAKLLDEPVRSPARARRCRA